MAITLKYVLVFALLVVAGIAGSIAVDGAGECGRTSPDQVAFQMTPCAAAAQDETAAVSDRCCSAVQKLGKNPRCLCAVMLSNTAKIAGIKPQVAMSIPKRCNLADRPVGWLSCMMQLTPCLEDLGCATEPENMRNRRYLYPLWCCGYHWVPSVLTSSV